MITQISLLKVVARCSYCSKFKGNENTRTITRHFQLGMFTRHLSTPSINTGNGNATNLSSIIGTNISDSSSSNVDPGVISDVVSTIVTATEPSFQYPSHYVMYFIDSFHNFAGIPYWEAIVGITILIRIGLIPLALKTMLNGARMAALRPDMQKVQDSYTSNPNFNELQVKQKYQKELQALFLKHNINPFRALLMPLAQLPIFLTFYYALFDMATYYPGLKTGGAFWFTDLSIADPYYILPIVNGISFLIMIELGADGMQSLDKNDQLQMSKWIMRGLGIIIIPFTASIPESVFMYWTANNSFSIAQTLVIKHTPVKKWIGMPDPPANPPPLRMRSPIENIREGMARARALNEAKEQSKSTKSEHESVVDPSSSIAEWKPIPMMNNTDSNHIKPHHPDIHPSTVPPPPPPPPPLQIDERMKETPITYQRLYTSNPKKNKKLEPVNKQ